MVHAVLLHSVPSASAIGACQKSSSRDQAAGDSFLYLHEGFSETGFPEDSDPKQPPAKPGKTKINFKITIN